MIARDVDASFSINLPYFHAAYIGPMILAFQATELTRPITPRGDDITLATKYRTLRHYFNDRFALRQHIKFYQC